MFGEFYCVNSLTILVEQLCRRDWLANVCYRFCSYRCLAVSRVRLEVPRLTPSARVLQNGDPLSSGEGCEDWTPPGAAPPVFTSPPGTPPGEASEREFIAFSYILFFLFCTAGRQRWGQLGLGSFWSIFCINVVALNEILFICNINGSRELK